jgi:T-complex protein 1 subunit gamma
MLRIIGSCIGTKIMNKWSTLACTIALDAVSTVVFEENGRKEIDIKQYAKVEKVCACELCLVTEACQIPGGEIEESCVLRGVMINKDVTHAKMRRQFVCRFLAPSSHTHQHCQPPHPASGLLARVHQG